MQTMSPNRIMIATGTLILLGSLGVVRGGDAAKENADATHRPLAACWADLRGSDDVIALRAMLELAATKEAVPFLKEHLKPIKGGSKHVAQLLTDLDGETFEVRQQASVELENLGGYAVPYLEKALANKPSLEVRKRIEGILAEIKQLPMPVEWLRARRAIVVLEHVGSADARDLLVELAKGRAQAQPTQEAEATLDRQELGSSTTVEARWTDLTGNDEAARLRAFLALSRDPKEALKFIGSKIDGGLQSTKDPRAEDMAQLIKNLGEKYDCRACEKASIELARIGLKDAEEALATAASLANAPLANYASQRARDLIERLVANIAAGNIDPRLAEELVELSYHRCSAKDLDLHKGINQWRLTACVTVLLEHMDNDDGRALLLRFQHQKPPPVSSISPDGLLKIDAFENRYGNGKWLVQVMNRNKFETEWEADELNPIETLVFSPDSAIVACGDVDGKVRLFDSRSGKVRNILEGHKCAITKLTFSQDGKMLTTESADRKLHEWDPATGEKTK